MERSQQNFSYNYDDNQNADSGDNVESLSTPNNDPNKFDISKYKDEDNNNNNPPNPNFHSNNKNANSRATGPVSLVAQHYNARPDLGKRKRKESRIYYMKNFNNCVKSILFSRWIPQRANR